MRDRIATAQLGLGHIWDADGSGGGPIDGDAVTCPLRGVTNVTCPCSGPKLVCFGAGLFPPGFTHCKTAVPPDDDRNMSVEILASPAALKLVVRLKFGFFVIVGVPIKCGLAAKAMAGANSRSVVPIAADVIAYGLTFVLPNIKSQYGL